ncbi:AAA family ATPase [Serratia bockelmannii]|uniref:AAA family ATPase n=1 Tax=Serratia bockelmannii TaxID=2703793 RepID=UPI0023607D61|nr:AAA family ATPase [Serratia bockelmannii]
MRIAITGTYSSGKTLTSSALSHYIDLPRANARMTRQIMPEILPGKKLSECIPTELIQLVVARHTERVVHEHDLARGVVSDGCSLQEWSYAISRVKYGADPNTSADLKPSQHVTKTDELAYFETVMEGLGNLFKLHVKKSFDTFIHLNNELPLDKDGHRPVNELFRTTSDTRLLMTLKELKLPYHIVSGSVEERLVRIVEILDLTPVISASEAIERAQADYLKLKKPYTGY